MNTLTRFSQNNHVGFAKVLVHNIVFLQWLKNGQKCLDKDGVNGQLLTDLSKAFDYLLHDLLIAKLAAYGFDYELLTLMQSYLWIENKELKLIILTARFLTLYSGFLKVQY